MKPKIRSFIGGRGVITPDAKSKLNRMAETSNRLNTIRGDGQFIAVDQSTTGAIVRLDVNALVTFLARSQYGQTWFVAVVTGKTLLSPNRWSYQIAECKQTSAGVFAVKPGGIVDTALNLCETINVESGTLGNGVPTKDYPPVMACMPIPIGDPVICENLPIFGTGTKQLFITCAGFQNSIAGLCSGASGWHH